MNSEKILVQRAQDGDVQAFEMLVKQHEQSVMSLCLHLMGNMADAQDVFQEAFIRVFNHLHGFRFESRFKTWLHRIVTNCALNHKRREKRLMHLMPSDESNLNPWEQIPGDVNRQPDVLLQQNEVWDVIESNLALLSMMERVVFVLRFREEFKLKEIAEITESSIGTVKNYLFRGTQKMKVVLKPYIKAEL